jgi:ABC-2 type transport system permease protein
VRAAWVIAWKDLKQRLRDRSALVAAFVAPLALAFIVSAAFGGGFTDVFRAHYLVVDLDQSQLSKAFTSQVLKSPQLRDQVSVATQKTEKDASAALARDEAGAAFVIPKGFSQDVIGNRKAEMVVLRNAESPIASDVAEAIAEAFTAQINATRLSVITAIRTLNETGGGGPVPITPASLARQAAADRIPIQLTDGQIGLRKVGGANYFGPAMAIFSLFFTTSFVARSLIAERDEGTLSRILAAPIPRPSLVIGKSLSAFVLGLMSFAVMFVVFAVALDVQWGDPLAIVVLSVTTVLAVMGLMTVMQTLAHTQEGASAVAQMLTISLALLGGNFFPLFQMPDVMQTVSAITPNGWALRGFTDVAYDGATLADLGPHITAIMGFAVVTGTIGIWRSRRLT